MSQALSVSKGELVQVVVVAERGVGLVHEAKSYRLLPPSQAPYHWLLLSSLFCYQLRYGGRLIPPLHFV